VEFFQEDHFLDVDVGNALHVPIHRKPVGFPLDLGDDARAI
jgi:hypothetical protein